jgi:hypothetical protein
MAVAWILKKKIRKIPAIIARHITPLLMLIAVRKYPVFFIFGGMTESLFVMVAPVQGGVFK